MFSKPPGAPRPPMSDTAPVAGLVDALKGRELSGSILVRNALWRALTIMGMLALTITVARWLTHAYRIWWVWAIAITLFVGGWIFTYFVWLYLDWLLNEIADTLKSVRERNAAEIRALDAYMAPPPAPVTPTINHYSIPRRNGSTAFVRTPVRHEKIQILAAGVINGRPISESEWASGPGKIFTISEWRTLMGELIERGLLCWVNPDAHAQGVELTDDGWDYFEGLVDPEQIMDAPLPERTNGRT